MKHYYKILNILYLSPRKSLQPGWTILSWIRFAIPRLFWPCKLCYKPDNHPSFDLCSDNYILHTGIHPSLPLRQTSYHFIMHLLFYKKFSLMMMNLREHQMNEHMLVKFPLFVSFQPCKRAEFWYFWCLMLTSLLLIDLVHSDTHACDKAYPKTNERFFFVKKPFPPPQNKILILYSVKISILCTVYCTFLLILAQRTCCLVKQYCLVDNIFFLLISFMQNILRMLWGEFPLWSLQWVKG